MHRPVYLKICFIHACIPMNMFCTGVYTYEYVLYRRVYLWICFVQACIPKNMFCTGVYTYEYVCTGVYTYEYVCTGVYTYEYVLYRRVYLWMAYCCASNVRKVCVPGKIIKTFYFFIFNWLNVYFYKYADCKTSVLTVFQNDT